MQIGTPLYGKSKIGQTLVWFIETENGKFRTSEGILGGQITVSEWTECLPTNEGRSNARTPEEQAVFEATSRIKKKLKTGYSADITLAGGKNYIEPMLAKSVKDYPELLQNNFDNILLNEKKNGCRATISAEFGLLSRKGEEFLSVPHIKEDFRKLHEIDSTAVVDFELNNEELRECLNELMKIVRRSKDITPELLMRSKEIVQAHVYDYYDSELPESAPYQKRMEKFKTLLASGIFGPSVKLVESVEVNCYDDIVEFFDDYTSKGGEGIIIRFKDAPYEHKRSKYLLKMKPDDDDECEILNIHKGSGNWGKVAKLATVKWKDRIFDVTIVGKLEECGEVLKNKESWIGKKVTFKYMGLTGLGTPNFGRIDIKNCFNDKSDTGIVED